MEKRTKCENMSFALLIVKKQMTDTNLIVKLHCYIKKEKSATLSGTIKKCHIYKPDDDVINGTVKMS